MRVVGLAADLLEAIRVAAMLPADIGDGKEITIQVEGIVGRVLCGYQGSFVAPTFGAPQGKHSWAKNVQGLRAGRAVTLVGDWSAF